MDDGKQDGWKDGELVRRTRGGDRAAFTALVERYRDMVYGVAYCYLSHAEDAQDAAQEAFISAYRRLGQLREPEKFAGWLRRLTLNGCADALRRRNQRQAGCPTPEVVDEAERIATRLAVQEALGHLPEPMRLTVMLCCLDGYSHAEVAQFLEIPLNTVRSRLQHAKRRLREEMQEMIIDTLNESKPDEQWTRQVVEEALRRGEAALKIYQKGVAVGYYDEALTAIAALPPGREQKRLTMDALWQKGNALDPLRSGDGNVALLEQSLDIAVELGDQPSRMKKLMQLGSVFYNKGQDRSAGDCFDKALALAQELNDAHSQAQCLMSLGLGRLWGDLGQGKALFEQALPLFEAARDRNGATYCRAMLDVAAELGPDNLRVSFSSEEGFHQPIIGFYAGCDVLQAEAGKVSHPSETCYIGYTWPNELAQSPLQISRLFWQSSHLRTILDTSVPVGGSWSGNAFSSTSEPLKATVTVLSDTETVTVPAGTFHHCLLTEQVTTEDSPLTEVNAEFRGTVRAWYAPGVGLVQTQVHRDNGLKATVHLQVYEITAESQDYLPLALGNRWEYGWRDVPTEYAAKEIYCVAAQEDNRWYVEHYAYAYLRP
jgi:RNA polymerase sigma-70 factor (ECF subfamily)